MEAPVTRPAANWSPTDAPRVPPGRGGFSMVELIVAVVILAIGVVGLAGTTAFVIRQVTLADVNTERSAALQSVVESVRSTPYASVGAGSRSSGSFSVSWSVIDSTSVTKTVRVITQGPGLLKDSTAIPTLGSDVQDTFSFIVLKP